MDEEQARAMIREEIRAAFQLLEDAAREKWCYTISDSVEEHCSEMIRASAESVVRSLWPSAEREPEPVNPFAPKRTPEQWAEALRSLIREAHEDGSHVWVDVEYYDGYAPKVRIGPPTSPGDEDPVVWGGTK